MNDQEYVAAIARSLYWGYVKDTTGEPGKWSELPEEGRKIWRKMAKRALRRIEELSAQKEATSGADVA